MRYVELKLLLYAAFRFALLAGAFATLSVAPPSVQEQCLYPTGANQIIMPALLLSLYFCLRFLSDRRWMVLTDMAGAGAGLIAYARLFDMSWGLCVSASM